jgi:hypothetical protein
MGSSIAWLQPEHDRSIAVTSSFQFDSDGGQMAGKVDFATAPAASLSGVAAMVMIAGASFSIVIANGCSGSGPPTAHLKGSVTIDGKEVPADSIGNVSFNVITKGQGRSAAVRIIDGKYDSPMTPMGKVKVFFNIQQPTGQSAKEENGIPYPIYRNLVPKKYEPGLELEVTGDDTRHDFSL